MTSAPQSRWYVVRTLPRAEMRAAQQLRQQNFEIYVPRFQKRRRHARRIDMVNAPLFPRYLFVALDLEFQRWRAVQSTVGVSHLICHGDSPAAIAPEVIAEIRSREDGHGFVTLGAHPQFARGDKVRVMDGPFSAQLGIFEETTDQNRVRILLDMLGRKVRAVLEPDRLAAA